MKTNPQATAIINQLHDFFWVYFDQRTAANVKRHPDCAIPLIKEAIGRGSLSKPKLMVYAKAMKAAVEYQTLQLKVS